jgi:hypothetical protein
LRPQYLSSGNTKATEGISGLGVEALLGTEGRESVAKEENK